MAVEKEDSKELERFFQTRKTIIRVALVIIGAVVVFFLFRKMKQDYSIN
jgi:hypothetical protein